MKRIIALLICLSMASFTSVSFAKGGKSGSRSGSSSRASFSSKASSFARMGSSTKTGKPSARGLTASFPKSTGTYSFRASNGKEYIGKATNLRTRIGQHIRSGKLNQNDIASVKAQPYSVSKKSLHTIETAKIRVPDILSKGQLANNNYQSPHSKNTHNRISFPKF